MNPDSLVIYHQMNPGSQPDSWEKKIQVHFSDKNWQIKKMKEKCLLIKQWKVQKLWLDRNENPLLIKEISPIEFSHVKELRLPKNALGSIECILSLKIPAIQLMDLSDNLLRSIKPLRKAVYKNLNSIGFYENEITDGECLFGMKLKAQFEILALEYLREEFTDVNWVIKLEMLEIKDLWIKSKKSIQQKKLESALKRKYPKTSLRQS